MTQCYDESPEQPRCKSTHRVHTTTYHCTLRDGHRGDHRAESMETECHAEWPNDDELVRQKWALAPPEWFVEHVATMQDNELRVLAQNDDACRGALSVMREGARLARFLRK